MQLAAAAIRRTSTVVDIGSGIRPQPFFEAERHLCIEPHGEYCEWLRANGYKVVQGTAQAVLPILPSVETIFLLDVIEHINKVEGLEVLRLARARAEQVVVFTPLGFIEQSYKTGQRDAWGMNGGQWQTHRSGWQPDEFPGWEVLLDAGFHGERGGAFFAIWGGR